MHTYSTNPTTRRVGSCRGRTSRRALSLGSLMGTGRASRLAVRLLSQGLQSASQPATFQLTLMATRGGNAQYVPISTMTRACSLVAASVLGVLTARCPYVSLRGIASSGGIPLPTQSCKEITKCRWLIQPLNNVSLHVYWLNLLQLCWSNMTCWVASYSALLKVWLHYRNFRCT